MTVVTDPDPRPAEGAPSVLSGRHRATDPAHHRCARCGVPARIGAALRYQVVPEPYPGFRLVRLVCRDGLGCSVRRASAAPAPAEAMGDTLARFLRSSER